MIANQREKTFIITPPAAIVDNASFTTASIDTLGYDYLTVKVIIGATDIAFTALKLQTSDTDGSYGDLTGALYGTSTNTDGSTSTLPSATDDNKVFVFEVDLKGKKRYFDLVATIGDGAAGGYMCAIAELTRGTNQPTSATERGAAQILRV